MLRLSLDALTVVDAIDRRGSFSAAARELFRVPSTVSYTIARLEEELGVALFERHGPRVALTKAGAELLREGRHLLKAAEDLEHRVRRVASGWETEFAIGMDSMFAPICLHADITDFYAVADQTRLRIGVDSLSGPWESLLDHRVETERAKQSALERWRGQPEDRLLRTEKGTRMRFEGQHQCRQAKACRFIERMAKDRHVAAMDAVEIADRNDATLQFGRQVFRA